MTTNYHTPIPFGAYAYSDTFNTRYSELDTAITSIITGTQSIAPLITDGTLSVDNTDSTGNNTRLILETTGVSGNLIQIDFRGAGNLRYRLQTDNTGTGDLRLNTYDNGGGFNGTLVNFYSDTLGIKFNGDLGFFNKTPVSKPSVSGSRGGNVALANLLTALDNLGLVNNNTT